MTFHEQKKSIVTEDGKVKQKAPIHRASALDTSSTLATPLRHQIVYVDVILPMGTTRIFGILHENKVYTKVSAFAPTGVSDPKPYLPLSGRDYNVYKQWLQIKSKSKTHQTAESMQWVESNAETLIREGKDRQSRADEAQKSYEYGQKLNKDFQIPSSSLKVGDQLELQFDKTIWTITSIEKDCVYAIQKGQETAPRIIGGKDIIRGYKLL